MVEEFYFEPYQLGNLERMTPGLVDVSPTKVSVLATLPLQLTLPDVWSFHDQGFRLRDGGIQ